MNETRKKAAEAVELAQKIITQSGKRLDRLDVSDIYDAQKLALVHTSLMHAGHQLIAMANELSPFAKDPPNYAALCSQITGAPAQAAVITALGLAAGTLKLEDFEAVLK